MFSSTPKWHRWDSNTIAKWNAGLALERFSRGGVTIPRAKKGSYVMIAAQCSGNIYCNAKPLNWAKPTVCSNGYEQVAFDKCCKIGKTNSPSNCKFAQVD